MLTMHSFVIFQGDPDQYCIEPYIFVIFQGRGVRLPMRGYRNFCQGGGGVQARLSENSSDVFFSFFKSSTLIFYSFTEGVQWLFQRRLYFSKVSERVQHFPGWGVQRGPNANFYRNPYNLSFSSPDPYPPLLTRSCSLSPS